MRNARYEGLISNESLDIYGFLFSPDFDASQQKDIHKFVKNIYEGKCSVESVKYIYKKLEIPVILIGKNVSKERKKDIEENCLVDLKDIFSRKEELSRNIELLKKSDSYANSGNLKKMKLKSERFLVRENDWFICDVFDEDTIVFIANPFVSIFKEDEIVKNPEYKEYYYSKLKGYKKYINSYSSEIESRQELFLSELNELFSRFYNKMKKENGIVIGDMRLNLNNGLAIISGSKKDSEVCLKQEIFPYETFHKKMFRLSEEEIKERVKQKKEYDSKCLEVSQRIDLLEKLILEKGLSYTVISKNDIHFDEETGNYKVWMNAQVSDEAHYGWFEEKDFINWINMEGRIPYKKAQIKYLSVTLERLSKKEYSFEEVIPKDKKDSSFEDFECFAKFMKNGTEITLDIDDIKKIINNEFGGMKKYTLKDFAKALKREKIKNCLKRFFR